MNPQDRWVHFQSNTIATITPTMTDVTRYKTKWWRRRTTTAPKTPSRHLCSFISQRAQVYTKEVPTIVQKTPKVCLHTHSHRCADRSVASFCRRACRRRGARPPLQPDPCLTKNAGQMMTCAPQKEKPSAPASAGIFFHSSSPSSPGPLPLRSARIWTANRMRGDIIPLKPVRRQHTRTHAGNFNRLSDCESLVKLKSLALTAHNRISRGAKLSGPLFNDK